jgi:hypothetical protein
VNQDRKAKYVGPSLQELVFRGALITAGVAATGTGMALFTAEAGPPLGAAIADARAKAADAIAREQAAAARQHAANPDHQPPNLK